VNAASLLPLFRSPQQERLLAELFVFTQEPISLSELARRAGTSRGGAHKEVERLERSGLVVSRISGRSRLIEANQASPLYPDLRGLLTKALGPEPLLREALSEVEGIDEAFIFGSWADPGVSAPQDIDLMVIGDPDVSHVYDVVSSVEAKVGRPINVAIRTKAEWENADGGFERAVQSRPRVVLV
jgi:predicted nucleotidyltransferase/biotin operon repressor